MNFLKRIFPYTILTFSILLLIYTFYKSEIFWDGKFRSYYKTYYLISSILIFFSIFIFFINNKIKQYLIISVISLVVSLYLFEGYLIFKENSKQQNLKPQYLKEQSLKEQSLKEQSLKEQIYENQTGNKWDRRKKIEIYKDLKKKNDKITVAFRPSSLLKKNISIIPLSGLSNLLTIYCNENGYYTIYKSDRYGFRNPDDEWDAKEIEYLLVGDSFTQGACVNNPNDIGSVLRHLSNKSVLNLGISGNGPLIEYATLREYLNKNVKKVLWIYFEGNDLTDIDNEKKNNILINYLKDLNFTQNLKKKQNNINNLLSNLIKEKEKEAERKQRNTLKFELVKFIKLNNIRYYYLSEYLVFPQYKFEEKKEQMKEFKKILHLTREITNKNNSKLYFVYLPKYSRYLGKDDNKSYNSVKNIINELKIPFIDMHKEVFEKEEDPLILFPFRMLGHYNVNGYKKVAETIYKFTKD